MSLGEKLKLLLKENNMTQENLAEQLEVSRQAVGKWVNDKGMPEVGKLVQISNIFKVSIDYLLKEDLENDYNESYDEKTILDNGYYVSKEMLDGYLLYNRQNVKQITGGVSLFILSNVFESFGYHNTIISILYWITMLTGLSLIIWNFFKTKQYEEIKNEHLTFDDSVFNSFKLQREHRRKNYTVMIIAGVIILLTSLEIEYSLNNYFSSEICNVCRWLIDTIWLTMIIWAGMSMHIDSTIIKNAEQLPKSNQMKKYRWIYTAFPVTVIAVLIGIITNAWSPYAPIIILFCCLLITTCKLFIESR